jgi:hypothetical protein
MVMPRIPLSTVASIIARGSWIEASSSSSDMWAPLSGPMKLGWHYLLAQTRRGVCYNVDILPPDWG